MAPFIKPLFPLPEESETTVPEPSLRFQEVIKFDGVGVGVDVGFSLNSTSSTQNVP